MGLKVVGRNYGLTSIGPQPSVEYTNPFERYLAFLNTNSILNHFSKVYSQITTDQGSIHNSIPQILTNKKIPSPKYHIGTYWFEQQSNGVEDKERS